MEGNVERSVKNSSCTIVCIGTPLNSSSEIDFSGIVDASMSIISYVQNNDKDHLVIFRSTLPPGSFNKKILPLFQENLGDDLGERITIGLMPEFLREGSLYRDFLNPGLLLVGQYNEKSGRQIARLFKDVNCDTSFSTIGVAEIVKQVCNAFHALKICFANEISQVCKELNVSGRDVMNIMCRDKKLNISESYLSPGAPFGGSCLEKDVQSLVNFSSEYNIDTSLINSINDSNEKLIERAHEEVAKHRNKTIGIIGMTFKIGTYDFRKSVGVKVANRLINDNKNVLAFDLDHLSGGGVSHHDSVSENVMNSSNFKMVDDIQTLVSGANVVLVTQHSDEYSRLLEEVSGCVLIDLTGSYPKNIGSKNNVVTFI